MFDLSGMTALVTGASGGLGSAIANALAAQGARLAVSGSNAKKLENFRSGLGGDHVALPCNLSDGAAVDALVPQAVEALAGAAATATPGKTICVGWRGALRGRTRGGAGGGGSRSITVNAVAPGF